VIVTRRGVTWDVDEPPFEPPYTEGPTPGFWNEWAADNWERDTLDVMARFVKPGQTFVDLGACIGALSMWAARHGADVVAVEPDPVAYEYLVRHCERNVPGKVRCVRAAVADYDGTCTISSHPQGWASSMSSVIRYADSEKSETVPCFTLQRIFADYQIQDCCLVKMDIEGMEALVLESVAPFLAAKGVPLHLSTHEPFWPNPVDPAWFGGFSELEGRLGGWEHVVAVP